MASTCGLKIVRSDGSDLQAFWRDARGDPVWSPDGRSIAFVGGTSAGTGIFLTHLSYPARTLEGMSDDRFDRIDQTLDRLLNVALDHGQIIAEIKGGMAEMQLDLRELRRDVSSLRETTTEHLTWHLGRT